MIAIARLGFEALAVLDEVERALGSSVPGPLCTPSSLESLPFLVPSLSHRRRPRQRNRGPPARQLDPPASRYARPRRLVAVEFGALEKYGSPPRRITRLAKVMGLARPTGRVWVLRTPFLAKARADNGHEGGAHVWRGCERAVLVPGDGFEKMISQPLGRSYVAVEYVY